MTKASGVLVLPNWDITYTMVFNSVTNNMSVEENGTKEMRGDKFSEEHSTLVIWLMRKGSRTSSSQPDDTGLIGSLIVKRVEETTSVEAHI